MTKPTEVPNTGHGHVRPRPDGVRARCGGPVFCRVCQQERAALAQQPSAPSAEPVTLADVLDALNLFNRPKPSEDDGPWEGGHFIRVDHLPDFINVISAAWFAPQQTAPQAGKVGAFVGVPQVTAAFCSKFPETAALMLNQGAEREYQRLTATQPAAPVPTAQPLTDAQIEEIQKRHNAVYHAGDVFSPQDFARNIELACAAAWGITMAATPAPTPEAP